MIVLTAPGGEHQLRVSAAIDRADINALASGFSRDLAPVLAILGAVLMIGFMLQIRAGLKPVHRVLAGVNAIRSGGANRLSRDGVPEEIAPLLEEVNALLDAQDATISRARDRAANLAHGLKTPLTALEGDIERLRQKGETEIADEIEELALRMRRHTERELARARLRHGRSTGQIPLLPHAQAILRTLKRTPAGEALDLQCRIEPALTIAIDVEDLNELIGNLAENAVRYARTTVVIEAEATADAITIRISDDGPGIEAPQTHQADTKFKRLDESGMGAGLGLAIAGDISDSVGGRLEMDRSALGGAEARITVPLRPRPTPPG
jgi:signal transduction histidine kinase